MKMGIVYLYPMVAMVGIEPTAPHSMWVPPSVFTAMLMIFPSALYSTILYTYIYSK